MKTGADRRSAYEDESQGSGYKRLVPVSCSAAGCPCRPQFITNTETGEDVCAFHYAADNFLWDRITAILRSKESRRLVQALDRLANSSHKGEEVTNPLICEVQRAGVDFGLDREVLSMLRMTGLVHGRTEEFIEPARAYEYRISMAHHAAVMERASSGSVRHIDDRERALSWTERALHAIAGRGKQIMDPSNFGREAA